jgi:hypothetical protein
VKGLHEQLFCVTPLFFILYISVKQRWMKNEFYLVRHETLREEIDKKMRDIVISIIFNTLKILKTLWITEFAEFFLSVRILQFEYFIYIIN